jgi:hypothetical protein
MPPPTPVPRITPNTTAAPAPAPSTASEIAKQLASLATRTGRPSRSERSASSGWPISQVALAFFTSPVAGERAPGMPTPMQRTGPARCSRPETTSTTAASVAS